MTPEATAGGRAARLSGLAEQFPQEAERDPLISPIRGGRKAAEAALARIDPEAYSRTRNYLDGKVTRLSMYLRHGVLSLAEVRDFAQSRQVSTEFGNRLINELAWRDYFQRVYRTIGNGVWQDREPWKVGRTGPELDEVPADILEARTGLACVDGFVKELYETGYLHNHARMWLASYLVHWRKVAWQAGARWFLVHWLDGDPASNNLSWQWVASTFSNKPYFFNRENLERYTGGLYCRTCPLLGRCDFEGSYESLASRLFQELQGPDEVRPSLTERVEEIATPTASVEGKTIVWVHQDDLNPSGPAYSQAPGVPSVFVWDDDSLRDSPIGLKRVAFISECLAELPAEVLRGDPVEQVAAFAERQGATRIVTTESPDPRFGEVVRGLSRRFAVEVAPVESFVRLEHAPDLRRFSRYWRRAEKSLFGRPKSR